MTYIIAGGSSGLGRSLAEEYAKRGAHLILISQDHRDTEALASHLGLVYGTSVTAIELDLSKDNLSFDHIDHALNHLPALQGILLPVGYNDKSDCVGLSDERLETITRLNYISPCKLINHLLPMLEKTSGSITGFGSIATARGRNKNAAYAASKSALESYFESLRHYLYGSSLRIQFYVLGYLDTNLAFAETVRFPRANPKELARFVYEHRHKNGKFFYPRYWLLVYRIAQLLPWSLFKRYSQ